MPAPPALPAPPRRPAPASLPRPADPRRSGTVGRALTAVAVAVIAAATLRSTPISPLTYDLPGHWCIACGDLGGADVLQNVLLFVPLGVGLELAGWSRRRVVLWACAFSTTVELVQFAGLTGRFATLGDVVTNTAGAWLGAGLAGSWPLWLTPSRRAARALAAAVTLLWTGALAVGAWALDRGPGSGPYPPRPSALPFTPDMGWFSGTVREGRFGPLRVAHRGSGAVVIAARTGRDVEGAVTATGSDPRPFPVPMLYVHGDEPRTPELVIGQSGSAAIVAIRLRAAALRLRRPSLRLRGVFAEGSRAPDAVELSGGFRDGALWLRAHTPAGTTERSLALRPTLGWALLLPFVHADGPEAPAMTALWLAAFTFPLGYWMAGATARRTVALAAAGGAVAIGLLGAPWLAGTGGGGALAWEWIAALAGAALGVGTWSLARRPAPAGA